MALISSWHLDQRNIYHRKQSVHGNGGGGGGGGGMGGKGKGEKEFDRRKKKKGMIKVSDNVYWWIKRQD